MSSERLVEKRWNGCDHQMDATKFGTAGDKSNR
jgi:hypothetical protein